MAIPISVKYRSEFIPSFNQTVSLLSDRCTDESMTSGISVVFDVTDLGGDLGERGVDGRLPKLTSSDQQVTATLKEYGGTFEVTDFEAFTSQSNERAKMTAKIMARMNRRLDKVLLAELDNASTAWNGGTAVTATPAIMTKIIASLEAKEVDINPNDVTVVATPMVRHQLMKSANYASSDYVSVRPYEGDAAVYTNQRKIKKWLDVGWIFSSLLPGVGTGTAKCYIFHRRAVGCAKPTNTVMASAGWDEQHHYHFASGTVKAACKILQQGGIIEFTHDDTAA